MLLDLRVLLPPYRDLKFVVPPGDTLRVNLQNNLPYNQNVSIVIPGLGLPTNVGGAIGVVRNPDGRIRSFVHETAPGTTGTYIWSNVKPGTFLYESGTHQAVQVQMGLYGAIVKNFSAGNAYQGIAYDEELLLLYSEIDPALHKAVSTGIYGTPLYPSTIDYQPKFFLINGAPYTPGMTGFPTFPTGRNLLFRFLNASLESHMPTLQGLYFDLVAEDGNPYPFPKKQYSALLPAGKTIDAVMTTEASGRHAIYDNSMGMTNGASFPGGMLTFFQIGSGVGITAIDDNYQTPQNTALNINAPGVIANDAVPAGVNASSLLVSGPASGTPCL